MIRVLQRCYAAEHAPAGLFEAVEIVIARHDAVRRVLLRHSYTDPAWVGGYLDDLPAIQPIAATCPTSLGADPCTG